MNRASAGPRQPPLLEAEALSADSTRPTTSSGSNGNELTRTTASQAREVPRPDRSTPPVEVRRSARRRRTAQARWEDGTVVVLVPAGMPAAEERRVVESLVAKVVRQQSRRQAERTDTWLAQRAAHLAEQYLDPMVGCRVRPAGVRWVSTMQHRWGSCTPATGQIRVSDVLATAPEQVVDGVLVHELAHLVESGHGPRFRRLEAAYPRLVESEAWLAGWTAGHRDARRSVAAPPEVGASALDADLEDADLDDADLDGADLDSAGR